MSPPGLLGSLGPRIREIGPGSPTSIPNDTDEFTAHFVANLREMFY